VLLVDPDRATVQPLPDPRSQSSRPSIRECRPAHPHLARDHAVLAAARCLAGFAIDPTGSPTPSSVTDVCGCVARAGSGEGRPWITRIPPRYAPRQRTTSAGSVSSVSPFTASLQSRTKSFHESARPMHAITAGPQAAPHPTVGCDLAPTPLTTWSSRKARCVSPRFVDKARVVNENRASAWRTARTFPHRGLLKARGGCPRPGPWRHRRASRSSR
jgi:hypothetical protein